MEELDGLGKNRIWKEVVDRQAHVVDVEDTGAVAERAASAEGVVDTADIVVVEVVVVVGSCCSKELEHDQRRFESVSVGVAAGRTMGSASAEEVIDRHAAAVVVEAGHNHLGDMARSVVVVCAWG